MLYYQKFGNGKQIMLAFHGFGQESSVYKCLAEVMPNYTFYAFDLFFHGKSQWDFPENYLRSQRWKELLQDFLDKENIQKFSLMGYSLGGKLALKTIELFSENLEQVWLLAPDGIKTNIWYKLATVPTGQSIFRKVILEGSKPLDQIVRGIGKMKLIDKSLLKLYYSETAFPERRQRVYYTWLLYSGIRPNIPKISQILIKKDISVQFFIGKHDRLINFGEIKDLYKQLNQCQLHIIPCGHNRLIKETANWILKNKKS